ncbi:MAG: hypothetical protein DMF79_16415 [Acidobacteria bacterium]|nr:MAG: hypothetical protein DMF79_16415 [Acidobacteriota bacterium]
MLAKGAIVEIAVACMVLVLTVTVLVGLFMRRRYRVCYSFVGYLLAVLVGDLLLFVGPSSLQDGDWLFGILGKGGFYSRRFWLAKELILNLMKFAVALELAYRTVRAFPGARSTARKLLFVAFAAILVSVAAFMPQVSEVNDADLINRMAGQLQPRVLSGTVWLLTGIASLVLWYRLPVDRFHKAILTGFVPFLLIFTIALNAIDSHGWSDPFRRAVNYVHTLAYVLLLAYWAWEAWAPPAPPTVARGPAPVLERQAV